MAKFCPMFSGSSGNCTYISGVGGGILIDAGVSAKKIEGGLAQCGVQPTDVKAIFVTHEHADHISGIKVFAKRYKLPVYMTKGTLEGIKQRGAYCEEVDYRILSDEESVAGLTVTHFKTDHDALGSCGYIIKSDKNKIAVCTDLGCITDEVRRAISGCNLVMIESNHDCDMLKCGVYTYQLKARILDKCGHLSNNICANELPRLCKEGTSRFVLAHLSRENNTPEKAREAAVSSLSLAGYKENKDYYLEIAAPSGNAPIYL